MIIIIVFTTVGRHHPQYSPLLDNITPSIHHSGTTSPPVFTTVGGHHPQYSPLLEDTTPSMHHCGMTPPPEFTTVGGHQPQYAPLWDDTTPSIHHCGRTPPPVFTNCGTTPSPVFTTVGGHHPQYAPLWDDTRGWRLSLCSQFSGFIPFHSIALFLTRLFPHLSSSRLLKLFPFSQFLEFPQQLRRTSLLGFLTFYGNH